MIIVYLITFLFSLMLMIISLGKRHENNDKKVSQVIAGLSANILFWVSCEICIQLLFSERWIIIFHELKYLAILSIPGLMVNYATRRYDKRIFSKIIHVFFLLMPLPLFFIIITNSIHHLFRKSMTVLLGDVNVVNVENGPFYYVVTLFVYLTVLLTGVLFYKTYKRQPVILRSKEKLLILGLLIPFVLNIIYQYLHYLTGLNMDITPVGFLLSVWVLYYVHFVYKVNNSLHQAKSMVYNQLPIASIFFDNQQRIFDINKKGLEIMCVTMKELEGKHINELSTEFQELFQRIISNKMVKTLYWNSTSRGVEIYHVNYLAIFDDRGHDLGFSIFFENITQLHQTIMHLKQNEYKDSISRDTNYNNLILEECFEKND